MVTFGGHFVASNAFRSLPHVDSDVRPAAVTDRITSRPVLNTGISVECSFTVIHDNNISLFLF